MSRRLLLMIVSITVAVCGHVHAQKGADAQAVITNAYRQADAAYNRADLNAVFASYSSNFVMIDQAGHEHQLQEVRELLEYSWRKPPTVSELARHASTKLHAISVEGTRATVEGEGDTELAMIDKGGMIVVGHDLATFEDNWILTANGWKIVRDHVLSFNRTASSQPSQQMLDAIAIIRQNTRNAKDLNDSINFGECMLSPSMQRFNVDERREQCRR